MRIQGLQKLTLLDYPGKVACTIFTAGCNLRCPFCHNASLVIGTEQNIDIEETEVFSFLRKRKGILDGVCVSGGEPLLQPDIMRFIKEIKQLGFEVKLDTNGTYPKKLKELAAEGLVDYVAMDIKNSLQSYGKTVGMEDYDTAPIEESASYLLSGVVPYEFRTTVVKELHTKSDFIAIGEWLKGAGQYYLQSFVDSGDLIGGGFHEYDKKIMIQIRELLKNNIKTVQLRGIE